MGRVIKNPYGLRRDDPDGEPVLAEDAERGRACDCICPGCREPLEARKGDWLDPYFAHVPGVVECGVGYQTALHLMAKEVLANRKRILLPELRVYADPKIWRTRSVPSYDLVPAWKRIDLDEVVLERKLGDIIPDVTARRADHFLLVEITVTHGIDPEKLRKIEGLGNGVVEFDFSAEDRLITKDDLERMLIDTYGKAGLGRSRWVYHPKKAETIERLNREHIEAHPRPSDKAPTVQVKKPYQPSLFDQG